MKFVTTARLNSLPTPLDSDGSHAPLKQAGAHCVYTQGLVAATIVLSVGLWSYLPTIHALVGTWTREPDYSHGFLVVPLALVFLWARRDRYPGRSDRYRACGWLLIAVGLAMRWCGARYYLEALDGWSIAVWLGGIVCVLAGGPVLWWALPSLAFLLLAVPLPFRAERAFSLPLQHIACEFSSWILQMIGEPALAMGNTIVIGDARLEVEQACSGLRIFVGIAALAYAYVMLVRRSWWESCILMAAVAPIAVIANAFRIVITAFMYQHISVEAGKQFAHDAAGWAMIVLAALLFGLLLWYLKWLVRVYPIADISDLIRREVAARESAVIGNRLPSSSKSFDIATDRVSIARGVPSAKADCTMLLDRS